MNQRGEYGQVASRSLAPGQWYYDYPEGHFHHVIRVTPETVEYDVVDDGVVIVRRSKTRQEADRALRTDAWISVRPPRVATIGAQLPAADATRALQQIDAEMESIVDAIYRTMGVDPAMIRRPAIADDAWMQRVRAAKAKAQQSPLWSYWESSVSPKYDDWQAARKGLLAKSMTSEDYDLWVGHVKQLRADVMAKGIKLDVAQPIFMPSVEPVPSMDTQKILKWGAIGALAIGGVAVLASLASSTKQERAPYERYRYGYLLTR